MTESQTPRMDPRVVRSRQAIIDAATTLFLAQGYVAATMDEIAATAGVSKRTVYNNFPAKEALFREVVLAATSLADEFVGDAARVLSEVDVDNLAQTLTDLGATLAGIVTSARVVRLRRLIIGEAHRFPDLAAHYYGRAPGQVIGVLADAFGDLDRRGLMRVSDPILAAEQFASLTIGAQLDRALFHTGGTPATGKTLAASAAAGVAAFLAAHTPT